MPITNLGVNSATTNDWLEAMKNQSASNPKPHPTATGVSTHFTKEHFEDDLRRASRRVASSQSGSKKK